MGLNIETFPIGGWPMTRMLIKSLLVSLALVLGGCAWTMSVDSPYNHYDGYLGPDGMDYRYSNRY
jgi:hypothetical protein